MNEKIKAVAFDIDGTLYPAHRQNLRLIPYVFAHLPTMLRFSKIRKQFHQETNTVFADFYATQAERIAAYSGRTPVAERILLDRIIYRGWESVYKKIRLYSGVPAFLCNLRNAGLKTAVLSDFPPDSKLRIWNIAELFDVAIGTEDVGVLKPAIEPFLRVAERLNVSPSEVLFVGNKEKYDVKGAKAAGMMTALITSFRKKNSQADYQFGTYQELENIILR